MKNYLFNFKSKELNKPQVIIKRQNTNTDFRQIRMQRLKGDPGEKGEKGEPGIEGTPGDRFTTKTIGEIVLQPKKNSVVIFDVEPGLAYITGNSVIVAQIPSYLDDPINSFEGTIQYYGKASGQIIINDIVNIKGVFTKQTQYFVNLDGVDGPPGPPFISLETYYLDLSNNSITIPEQSNQLAYYVLNLIDNDNLNNINSNLTIGQQAIILIKLKESNNQATISKISNININYNDEIILNEESQNVFLKLYNIENNLFCEYIKFFNPIYNYITV